MTIVSVLSVAIFMPQWFTELKYLLSGPLQSKVTKQWSQGFWRTWQDLKAVWEALILTPVSPSLRKGEGTKDAPDVSEVL